MENKKIKIVYLYAEIMSYNVAIFREYVSNYNAEVHVIHWDKQKKTPYKAPQIKNVFYYGKSEFTPQSLFDFVANLHPDIVFTSGWMDKLYIKIAKKLRKKNIPVTAISDTQFYNNLRQNLGRIYFRLFIKKAFSHLWVAGTYQFEYAKKLGYLNHEITINSLSADLTIFNPIFKNTIQQKEQKYPHQFLFAGRFAPEKGLDILIKAWESIEDKKDWKLCLVGNGPMKNNLKETSDIIVHDFVQPEAFQELIAQSGCFVLPSKKEPWALVLHEFSAAGMPLICSNTCGAAPVFLIPGYNGFSFKSELVEDLKNKMKQIINSSDEELVIFAKNSHQLGQRLTPQTVAASSLAIIKN